MKIDPEFKALIPPLSHAEFDQLEQNILTHGRCREAIKLWRGYIIDGFNRHAICTKHGISFATKALRFKSKTEAKIWIAENQLGRRNLTDAMRIEIAAAKLSFLQDAAKENQSTGTAQAPINLRKSIAQSAGVSEQTVQRYMKISGSGAQDLIRQVREGNIKIGTAYNLLTDKPLHAYERTTRKLYSQTDPACLHDPITYKNVLHHLDDFLQFYGIFTQENFTMSDGSNMGKLHRVLERQAEIAGSMVR